MATVINIKLKDDYLEFIAKLRKAASGDFKKEFATYVEALGTEFLRIVQDEIIRRKVVDTRLLLNSFTKGAEGNIWTIEDAGLKVEVGTNVDYATFVNDGHWTNPAGVAMRFIPGTWAGGKFVYQPGAKTGMVLKQQWIEGAHYMEAAVRIFEKMMPDLLEAKLQQWLDTYFG